MTHYDDAEHAGTGYSWPNFERPPRPTRSRVVMRDDDDRRSGSGERRPAPAQGADRGRDVRRRRADEEWGDDPAYGRRNRSEDYYHGSDPGAPAERFRYNDYDPNGERGLDGFDRWLERGRPAAGEHTGRGPKGYQRSDERIREDVCECLTQDGEVDASAMEVQVENGEVTISGTADSRRAKRRAADLIEDLPGVRDVHNQLRLRSS